MDFGSYLPLLLPLFAVPLLLASAPRLHPALASWLTAASCVVLTAGTAFALGLFTVAGLAGLSIVADLGHLSTSTLDHADITDLPVDATAAALLVAACVAGALAATRRVKALAKAHRLAAESAADSATDELLVLPDERPVAHALPGRPGRIIVSTGMLAGLTPVERRALLAHERAHLSRSHHLFVAVVDILAAANPLLRPLRKVVRYTTERWADELAARAVGSRAVVARAVGKAALATDDATSDNPVALAAAAGEVPRRVAALLSTAQGRRPRQLLTSPMSVFALAAVVLTAGSACCAVEAAGDLHQVLALAHFADLFPGHVDRLR
ncbi:MAG TPA: M56 family metallopeptidase [Pseudonocardiaceae bacterium]|jgi:Zn-dependent protease with chaperone function|nr:M56 family metallopeptidase [Pseudonocardiaceae bacterium]